MKLLVTGGIVSLVATGGILAEEIPANEVPAPEAEAEAAAPAEEAAEEKAAAEAGPAYLGVASGPLPEMLAVHLKLPIGEGVVVRAVPPDGPAAAAGIVEHDVITRIAGKAITSPEELREETLSHQPGDEVEVELVHLGETVTRKVTLGSRDAVADAGPGINQFMLEGMPQDQARRIRDLIERQLNQGGEPMGAFPPMDEAIREMRERMVELLENGGLELPAEGEGVGIAKRAEATVRMRDAQGSIEVKTRDDSKEVTVRGRNDEIVWTGPWDTDQDRAAAPDDIRTRIEALNLDNNLQGGIRLNIRPLNNPPPAE